MIAVIVAAAFEPKISHRAERRDQVDVAAVDQAALAHRERLGGMHRMDDGERRARAEAEPCVV
jgi:hypothetical protein